MYLDIVFPVDPPREKLDSSSLSISLNLSAASPATLLLVWSCSSWKRHQSRFSKVSGPLTWSPFSPTNNKLFKLCLKTFSYVNIKKYNRTWEGWYNSYLAESHNYTLTYFQLCGGGNSSQSLHKNHPGSGGSGWPSRPWGLLRSERRAWRSHRPGGWCPRSQNWVGRTAAVCRGKTLFSEILESCIEQHFSTWKSIMWVSNSLTLSEDIYRTLTDW